MRPTSYFQVTVSMKLMYGYAACLLDPYYSCLHTYLFILPSLFTCSITIVFMLDSVKFFKVAHATAHAHWCALNVILSVC